MKKDKLEEFIQNNKEEINQFEPQNDLWASIEDALESKSDKAIDLTQRKEARHIKLYTKHLWQAAAVIFVVVVSGYFLIQNQNTTSSDTPKQFVEYSRKGVSLKDLNPELAEAESHYIRKISQKKAEVKEKAEDFDLDINFQKDLSKLDSMYTVLKSELYEVPSQEKIHAAMVQNLQMRIEILNQQLDILKRLKQFKQESKKDKEDENIKSL